MRIIYILTFIVLIISQTLLSQVNNISEIRISTDKISLKVGESEKLTVVYIDSAETERDTLVVWRVSPDSLGYIDSLDYFIAEKPGEGFIYASLDSFMDSVKIEITNETEDEKSDDEPGNKSIIISPSDTSLQVGTQLQFAALSEDSSGTLVEINAVWSLHGDQIGSISNTGYLEVTSPGMAMVKASLNNLEATSIIIAVDTTIDSSGVNYVTITRSTGNPNGYSVIEEISEGESWTIGGLPYPMNVLNGGQVYFPFGSLKEDIRIHVNIPGFSDLQKEKQKIVGSVSFEVYTADSLKEPYYFEIPVKVSIPFKRGLLNNLGIDPASLGLYFAGSVLEDSIIIDSVGITNTIVDSASNRIFSDVAHFSTLLVAEKLNKQYEVTGITKDAKPSGYHLLQNYPNPFNPSTTIGFSIPEDNFVNVEVYNILGQKIATLLNGNIKAGSHILKFNASDLPSGIYIYSIKAGRSSEIFNSMKKMILIK